MALVPSCLVQAHICAAAASQPCRLRVLFLQARKLGLGMRSSHEYTHSFAAIPCAVCCCVLQAHKLGLDMRSSQLHEQE